MPTAHQRALNLCELAVGSMCETPDQAAVLVAYLLHFMFRAKDLVAYA